MGAGPQPQVIDGEAGEDWGMNDDDDDGHHVTSTPALSWILSILCFPFLPNCCISVSPGEEILTTHYGEFSGRYRQPGLVCCVPACGRNTIRIDKKVMSIDLTNTKIIDVTGTPLNVSAIVNYRISNAAAAAFDVQNSHQFVANCATSVLKTVVSQYPYEAAIDLGFDDDGNDNNGDGKDEELPCLKKEPRQVQDHLKRELQAKVSQAGVRIISFLLNELSYSQEVAAGMLRKQQATSLVQARTVVVKGAVEIVGATLSQLKQRGITMSDEARDSTIRNMLTVMVADTETNPVVGM